MKKLIGKMLSAVSAAAVTAAGLPYIATVQAADTVFPYTIEGEKLKGADLWTSIYETKIPDYSGEGFWYLTNASGSFTVTVPEDAMYQLTVRGAQILSGEGSARQQAVKVNGVKYTIQAGYSAEWRD